MRLLLALLTAALTIGTAALPPSPPPFDPKNFDPKGSPLPRAITPSPPPFEPKTFDPKTFDPKTSNPKALDPKALDPKAHPIPRAIPRAPPPPNPKDGSIIIIPTITNPSPITTKRSPQTYAPPTWDNLSLSLLGSRLLVFGGEFHPFRLPVPSLWRDVLEKMKALGLNTVSFSVPWALLEGKPGEFRAEGVFDVGAFLRVAQEVGLWVVARPGPYMGECFLCYFLCVVCGVLGWLTRGCRWGCYGRRPAGVDSED